MHLNYAFKFSLLYFICYYVNNVIMSNLTKLKINALDITKNNYMTWAVGVEIHLRENEL